jgi:hypothetical protein
MNKGSPRRREDKEKSKQSILRNKGQKLPIVVKNINLHIPIAQLATSMRNH